MKTIKLNVNNIVSIDTDGSIIFTSYNYPICKSDKDSNIIFYRKGFNKSEKSVQFNDEIAFTRTTLKYLLGALNLSKTEFENLINEKKYTIE